MENDDERLFSEPCDLLVIGPGPGKPSTAGLTLEVLARRSGKVPILGVCLGHQAIAQFFGGRIVRAKRAVHGKTSQISHNRRGFFEGLPQRFAATRYHSLIVDRAALPPCLEVTAQTADGEIMGLAHRDLPVEGVQFHPESVLSFTARNRCRGSGCAPLRCEPAHRRCPQA